MNTRPVPTHIKVSMPTHAALMKEKESRGLKSVDATIQALLAEAGHKGEDVLEPTSQEEPPESAQKKRKIKVMEPLYSYEDIQKRDGMLKYLTGVSQEQFNMLLDLVAKVRERIFFFSLSGVFVDCCGFCCSSTSQMCTKGDAAEGKAK